MQRVMSNGKDEIEINTRGSFQLPLLSPRCTGNRACRLPIRSKRKRRHNYFTFHFITRRKEAILNSVMGIDFLRLGCGVGPTREFWESLRPRAQRFIL